MFPLNRYFYSGETLKDLNLAWYSNIDPHKTFEIVNYFKTKAQNGERIFFDIYSKEEKKQILKKKIPDFFSLKVKMVPLLPSATQVEALPTSVPFMTVFRMLWNYPKKDITLLL